MENNGTVPAPAQEAQQKNVIGVMTITVTDSGPGTPQNVTVTGIPSTLRDALKVLAGATDAVAHHFCEAVASGDAEKKGRIIRPRSGLVGAFGRR